MSFKGVFHSILSFKGVFHSIYCHLREQQVFGVTIDSFTRMLFAHGVLPQYISLAEVDALRRAKGDLRQARAESLFLRARVDGFEGRGPLVKPSD